MKCTSCSKQGRAFLNKKPYCFYHFNKLKTKKNKRKLFRHKCQKCRLVWFSYSEKPNYCKNKECHSRLWNVVMFKHRCLVCSGKWKSKTLNPYYCKYCKSSLWNGKSKFKLGNEKNEN